MSDSTWTSDGPTTAQIAAIRRLSNILHYDPPRVSTRLEARNVQYELNLRVKQLNLSKRKHRISH